MRFLSDEEAREAMEKELEQPAPQHILDILITARPIPGKETSEVPITTLENCAVERSKEVAAETEDEEVSVTIQEHIERSKEVKEEPVMMIGKAGNTVTERVKELERDPGDVETKENDLAETTVETTTSGHANAWMKEEKEVPIERGKEVTEEPAMMIGKAGNTVTERVKGLERDPDDVAKKENDPPNGGSCGKSGASLKTASKKSLPPGDRGGSIADGERQEDTAECGTRQGAWERTGGESERLADV